MNECDCVNLRAEAAFEVPICRNVFWVPVNVLGKTRYTNEEMRLITSLDPVQKREKIQTLYEAVQLFLLSKFHETLDVVYEEESGLLWEHHKPGYYAVLSNCGCCASDAAWLQYLLKEHYSEMGYFSFARPNCSGHVYNYIYQDGWFYLYDLCPISDKNVASALVETGNRMDYFKAKYISGALIKCRKLEDYAYYFKRIQLRGGFDHLFFQYKTDGVPPIATIQVGDVATFYYPNNISIIPLLDQETPTVKFQLVNAPTFCPDWDNLIMQSNGD